MDTTNNDAAFWVAGYTDYLRDVVGAADTTRLRYLPTVQRFIATCSGPGAPDWTGLSVLLVTEFIREEAAHKSRARPHGTCECHALLPAIPGLARRCSERARPRHPEPSGVHGMPACRRTSPRSNSRGCCNVLPRLVRRRIVTGRSSRCWPVWACEPARSPPSNLTTWIGVRGNSACAPGSAAASGCCHCPRRSAPRWPSISGTAARIIRTVGYFSPSPIQRGPSRPRRSARSCGAIWCVPASRCGRLTGAHMLRHTAASRMVNGGASFKEVADVLGHRSLQTTGIYAKLDLDALAGVALPWIGGAR